MKILTSRLVAKEAITRQSTKPYSYISPSHFPPFSIPKLKKKHINIMHIPASQK